MLSELPVETPPIRSTYNSFRVLDEIKRRDGAGVTEIARALDISKSTAHDHLLTLLELGCVNRVEDVFVISPLMLTYGGHARQKEELYELANVEIDELAAETGETAKVVMEVHGRGVYLYQSHGSRAVRTDAHTGTIVHLHTTAVGKAILSALPRDRVGEIIDQHGLPRRTDNTITSERDLFDELDTIAARGVAFDNEERIHGIRCVAAPIVSNGNVLGALSISGPTRRIDDVVFRENYPGLVKETARLIEINATYARSGN